MQILQIKFTNVLHSCSSSPAPHIIFLLYFLLRPPNFSYPAMAATTTTPKFSSPFPSPSLYPSNLLKSPFLSFHSTQINHQLTLHSRHFNKLTTCKAAKISVAEEDSSTFDGNKKWVPVVPVGALPKGERRVIIQDGEEILLLWYKNQVFAIENRSPAEGAYTEGLINAKLTQDGCIVCPSTDSTFDLQTGAVKEWYPKNPVLRALTPVLRNLFVYPAKTDEENIYISITRSGEPDASAEIVFSGRAQPGVTASDVNVNEVRMVIDENDEGFGFTRKNELINGKAAILGFFLLLDFELLTGKGLLKGTGFLDFLYSISNAVN